MTKKVKLDRVQLEEMAELMLDADMCFVNGWDEYSTVELREMLEDVAGITDLEREYFKQKMVGSL